MSRSLILCYCLLNVSNAESTAPQRGGTNNSVDINNIDDDVQQQQDVVKHILHNLSTTSSATTTSTTPSWMHDEEATLLDVFGQVAKEVLTNRMVSIVSFRRM